MEAYDLEILDDPSAVSRNVASDFIECGTRAIAENGRFAVVLAGGNTPRSVYRLLASNEFRTLIDWTNVFFFFGDERDVPPDSDQSNYKMARESLFEPLGASEENIFRWRTELGDPEETARRYDREIREFFEIGENGLPQFDLVLLGMGEDGHTASLFPGSPALSETGRIAVANRVEKLDAVRLTLTVPAINRASRVLFIVTGKNKSFALKEVINGRFQPDKLPSQMVKPGRGRVRWIVDRAAASRLKA